MSRDISFHLNNDYYVTLVLLGYYFAPIMLTYIIMPPVSFSLYIQVIYFRIVFKGFIHVHV